MSNNASTYNHHDFMNFDEDNIRNRTLIVVVPEILPPFVNYLNISYKYEQNIGFGPGIVWQILRSLHEQLNVSYHVEAVAMKSEQRWDNAFKILQNSETELIVGATVMQYHSNHNVSFTVPFQFEETGLIYQTNTDHLFNQQNISLGPFSAQIWLVAFFCLLLSSFIMHLSNFYLQKLPIGHSFFDYCLTFFSVICRHSVNFKGSQPSQRFLIMTWYSGSLFLFIIYMVGCTFMPNYKAEPIIFKTIKSVVDTFESSKRYKLVLNRSSSRTEMLKKSVLLYIRHLWRYVKENDAIIYTDTIEDGVELVRQNSNYFFMGPYDTLKLMAARDCRLQVVPEGFLPAFMGIALKADSPYVRRLNNIILELIQFGFIEKWIRNYGIYVSTRFNGTCQSIEYGQFFDLKLSILRGPFILFALGMAGGLLFFIAELLRWAYLHSRIGKQIQRIMSMRCYNYN